MHTLVAGSASVGVDRVRGGRLTSLSFGGHELLVPAGGDEPPDPLMWGCFPMVPFAGRLRGGRFMWGGRLYELPQNHAGHAMHGTLFDDRWALEQSDERYLRLRARLEPRWPFAGWVVQEIALGPARLDLRMEVHSAEAPFPATAGWHPWFRRQLDPPAPRLATAAGAAGVGAGADLEGGHGRAAGADGELTVDLQVSRWYPRDLGGLPTGAVVPVPPRRSWDDCFTGVTWPARLSWPGAGELSLTSTASHVVLYDQHPQGICVEPQTGPPDAFNLERARTVRPGQPLVVEAALTWRDEDSAAGPAPAVATP